MKSVRDLHDELSSQLLEVSNQFAASAGMLETSSNSRIELRNLDEKISQLCQALNEEIPTATQKSINIFSVRIRSAIHEINSFIEQMSFANAQTTNLRSLLSFPRQFLESEKSTNRALIALTKREKEILALLPKGATAKVMASELFLTEATIKSHLASIYRKFEVENRTQALAIALENKLITF